MVDALLRALITVKSLTTSNIIQIYYFHVERLDEACSSAALQNLHFGVGTVHLFWLTTWIQIRK